MRPTFEEACAETGFDPSEAGYCDLCGQEADLDSGVCETCNELREDGFDDADIAAGAYWFAVNYHGGQFTELYAAQSRSPYRPGRCERGPDESAQYAYDAHLVASGLEADEPEWCGEINAFGL